MSVVDKIWSFLGVVEEDDGDDFIATPSQSGKPATTNNVVSIHSNKMMKVVISEPTKFEEVQDLADHLKNRKQLILNFEKTPPDVAQRLADFLCGTIYALDGQFQQLGTYIYVFAPNNMEFSREHHSLMRKHGFATNSGGNR